MNTLLTALASAHAWLRRYILPLTGIILVVTILSVMRACSLGGQVQQVLDAHPKVLTNKQASAVIQKAAQNAAAARQNKDSAQAVLHAVAAKETHITQQLHAIDSLTSRYHETVLDSTAPSAVHRFLANYKPGPDSL